MSVTLNNTIPFVPENTIDPASGLNEALNHIDPLLQCHVLTIGDNLPPNNPQEGDRHIVGTSPSGAWAGKAGQLARLENGAWAFHPARLALCEADKKLHGRFSTGWQVLT